MTLPVRRHRPRVEQLIASPELAVLAVLEASVDIAVLSMAAAWPQLNESDVDSPTDPPGAALDLLGRARDLGRAIHRYRLALALADRRDHDLPF